LTMPCWQVLLNSNMVKAESFMKLRKYNVTLESYVSRVCKFRELWLDASFTKTK